MQIEDRAPSQRLFDAGLRYVSIRKRSEKEIVEFLKKKSLRISGGLNDVQKALDKLREYGYVDDHAFASWVTQSRRSHNPHGTARIIRELKNKGVSEAIISGVMRELAPETKSEKELAQEVLAKVIGRYTSLPVLEQKRKLFGVLGRRGFSFTVIPGVVDDFVQKKYNNT